MLINNFSQALRQENSSLNSVDSSYKKARQELSSQEIKALHAPMALSNAAAPEPDLSFNPVFVADALQSLYDAGVNGYDIPEGELFNGIETPDSYVTEMIARSIFKRLAIGFQDQFYANHLKEYIDFLRSSEMVTSFEDFDYRNGLSDSNSAVALRFLDQGVELIPSASNLSEELIPMYRRARQHEDPQVNAFLDYLSHGDIDYREALLGSIDALLAKPEQNLDILTLIAGADFANPDEYLERDTQLAVNCLSPYVDRSILIQHYQTLVDSLPEFETDLFGRRFPYRAEAKRYIETGEALNFLEILYREDFAKADVDNKFDLFEQGIGQAFHENFWEALVTYFNSFASSKDLLKIPAIVTLADYNNYEYLDTAINFGLDERVTRAVYRLKAQEILEPRSDYDLLGLDLSLFSELSESIDLTNFVRGQLRMRMEEALIDNLSRDLLGEIIKIWNTTGEPPLLNQAERDSLLWILDHMAEPGFGEENKAEEQSKLHNLHRFVINLAMNRLYKPEGPLVQFMGALLTRMYQVDLGPEKDKQKSWGKPSFSIGNNDDDDDLISDQFAESIDVFYIFIDLLSSLTIDDQIQAAELLAEEPVMKSDDERLHKQAYMDLHNKLLEIAKERNFVIE